MDYCNKNEETRWKVMHFLALGNLDLILATLAGNKGNTCS